MSKFSTHSHKANQLLTSVVNQQAIIAKALTLILLVSTAWLCGHLLWHLMGSDSDVEHWRPAAGSATGPASATHQGTDISSLLNANLFGVESKEAAPKATQQVVDAPKTRLNLVLVGVVASSIQKNSLAVIANKGSQDTYGVGEVIDGTRAKLNNVLSDRVIIENQGRNETLMLEGIEYKRATNKEVVNKQPQSNVQGNNPKVDTASLDKIKAEISSNPQQLLKYIRLSQVNRDGKLIGYRVRPGRERTLFDSIGLQDGDIAVELNGADLKNPASMGTIWKSLGDLSELNLTVERNGQRYDIYLQL
ncbi:type II secretion system protein GspC [Vibrio ezurae]|uniref:Putative general secretory pathway protein C n=1 Tax=Vibrio ezurae NBRC 102218 TaxID=1219080 RepID=U3B4Z2_9VIBR|nr:type II secretion system protein GspC [Vibrio ezurae]GAD80512.1 putative general secretory pathway protein C [Vibrio ezurae NBRC 102218]